MPFASLNKQIDWLARDAKVTWKRNGLRHSFCSYRMAVTESADKVAFEAGNSPAMLFKHYRELVTRELGEAWFGIMPRVRSAMPSNVLPLPAPEAATAATQPVYVS